MSDGRSIGSSAVAVLALSVAVFDAAAAEPVETGQRVTVMALRNAAESPGETTAIASR